MVTKPGPMWSAPKCPTPLWWTTSWYLCFRRSLCYLVLTHLHDFGHETQLFPRYRTYLMSIFKGDYLSLWALELALLLPLPKLIGVVLISWVAGESAHWVGTTVKTRAPLVRYYTSPCRSFLYIPKEYKLVPIVRTQLTFTWWSHPLCLSMH